MKNLKRYQYERYAILCLASYPTTFNHLKYGFSRQGRTDIKDREGKTIIRVLWSETGDVIVVFKGSHSMKDWLINAAIFPKRISMGKDRKKTGFVHFGFHFLLFQPSLSPPLNFQHTIKDIPSTSTHELLLHHYSNGDEKITVYQQLKEALDPLISMGKRVSFTGHSSGGAMAVIAAELLQHHYPDKIKRVVTFGQPAMGFWSFRQHYSLEKKTYRISCDVDIVTFLPGIPFLFWHVGKLLWLHNDKIYENIPTPKRLYMTLRSWLFRPIAYHYMEKYIRRKNYFDHH
ncbi:lipase family protein [Thaumasiovibrio subtropicus]|uniref:lipase family protein n=1 Tax=Thaumasiovibrio subtropicus TaxID=1891207 RepID=UPI000B35A40F|nr:DUF2974 domain-containing protein [Thaumasiovibrio subtropicus]